MADKKKKKKRFVWGHLSAKKKTTLYETLLTESRPVGNQTVIS